MTIPFPLILRYNDTPRCNGGVRYAYLRQGEGGQAESSKEKNPFKILCDTIDRLEEEIEALKREIDKLRKTP